MTHKAILMQLYENIIPLPGRGQHNGSEEGYAVLIVVKSETDCVCWEEV